MKLRTLALFAALLAATPGLHAQVGPTIRVDKVTGKVTIEVPNGAAIVQNPGNTVIYWRDEKPDDPTPGPKPPSPQPPTPQPPDPPAPPPPAWGPLARAMLLYENDVRTGREVYHGQPFETLLTSIVPKDGAGVPLWRVYDDDTAVSEMGWAEAREMLKSKRGPGEMAPVLYLFDAQGRIEKINLDETPDLAALKARLESLGVKP